MKPTGASASTFFVERLAADALLQQANGATRPSFQTTISPSSTVPSGSARARATISGKRSVTSSSPRDQIQTCARALDELRADAVVLPLDDPVGRRAEPRRELARPASRAGGRGRTDTAGRASSGPASPDAVSCGVALGARRRAPVGVAHHALRDQLGVDAGALGERALHQQLADADAEAAADQLVEQEAAGVSSSSQYEATRSRLLCRRAGRAAAAGAPRPIRRGRGRSSRAGGGSTCATVSAKSPTAW